MRRSAGRLCAAAAACVIVVGMGMGWGQEKAPSAKKAATQPATGAATQPVGKPGDKAFQAFAKKLSVPVVKVPVVAKAPKIDGVLDAVYKKKATPLKYKFLAGGSAKPTAATTVYVLSTKAELIIFFECKSPDMDALLADVRDHDGQVWNDDSVEIFIDPTNKRQVDGYVHIAINAVGTTAESKGPAGAQDSSWNPKLRLKTKVGKKAWTVEVAIGFKDLVPDPKKINRAWAANFNRMAYLIEGNEDTAWSPTGGTSSHVPGRFGCLWMEAGTVDNTKK